MTSEDLKKLLANPPHYVNGNVLDADKCRQLAEDLMKRFWIKKGEMHYWIKDIEFYIYCDSHRDIITYPRNCEAGCWFLHDSGVDIAFRSRTDYAKHPRSKRWKPRLTKNSVFGGILIREIERVEKLELPDGAVESFKGPWLSRNELFYSMDAFQPERVSTTSSIFTLPSNLCSTRINRPSCAKSSYTRNSFLSPFS